MPAKLVDPLAEDGVFLREGGSDREEGGTVGECGDGGAGEGARGEDSGLAVGYEVLLLRIHIIR